MKMKNDYTALIDADFIKYLVIYDIEKMYKMGYDLKLEIPTKTLIDLIEKRLEHIRKSTSDRTKNYIYLFSGKTKDNHRALIAHSKKYKGTRTYSQKFPKENVYREFVELYIAENYPYHKEDDLEADDLCVMAHNENTYIYSNDKDLRASPGIHFDIKKDKFVHVSYKHQAFLKLNSEATLCLLKRGTFRKFWLHNQWKKNHSSTVNNNVTTTTKTAHQNPGRIKTFLLIQYNITLLPSVSTLIARGLFCGAKYTHHTFIPIIKHLVTTTANKHPALVKSHS